MNRQQMEELAQRLNQDKDVENARVVEFLGKPHIHIDLADGDIETISEDGAMRVVPIHTNTKRQ